MNDVRIDESLIWERLIRISLDVPEFGDRVENQVLSGVWLKKTLGGTGPVTDFISRQNTHALSSRGVGEVITFQTIGKNGKSFDFTHSEFVLGVHYTMKEL